ncbi:MAG: hypothetical protein BEU00_00950 [Marine Group III euryarchaeote CG-Epi3]|jgi:subtilase family serine protease|uniref:CARDB domain-containing protein n=1 Tax=Marine Group III euryarchaeote CG-Epi3 TaxID=1888997 RepID=A0A1J5TQ57_9ARCH|nr:MAG: hypothetical protein BEU00_00950 [Marine Group III euryarchaeote CG-Epi3]
MANRILTGIYAAFALLVLTVIFTSNAKAVDVDLEPINFTFNPDYPLNGEPVEISFVVVNTGNEPANDVKIIVWNSTSECGVDDECVPIFESTESLIDQSKSATIEFTCNPDGIDGCGGLGEHVLTISVDYEDDISETDEDNNKIIFEYTVFEEDLSDLRSPEAEVLPIRFTPEVPAVGDSVDILVFFENSGGVSCTEFKIKFDQTFDGETETIEDPRFYTIVDPESPAQFNITWQPEYAGLFQITIYLDSANDIEEFNESDNIITSEVTIRAHTPELTLNEFRNMSVNPKDIWLDDIFADHEVNLTTHILNEDYVVPASSVRVGYYDLPENGTESLIGYVIVDTIDNATKNGEEIFGGTASATVTWSSESGTSILGNHTIIVRIDPLNEIEEWFEEDNNFSFNLFVLESKPDINILDLQVIGKPVRGIPSDIQVTIFNEGALYASKYPVDLRVDGELIKTWEITINQGEELNLTVSHTWQVQQPIILVQGDYSSQVDELNEDNNVNSLLVNVAAPEYDFSIIDISANDPVFKGDHMEISLLINNKRAEIPDFKFSLYVDNSSTPEFQSYDFEGNPIYFVHEENLGYNETKLVSIFWRTTDLPGNYNLTIVGEISGSDFVDLNNTDNIANISVVVKPRNFQLSVEMRNLPNTIFLNQTLEISVSALNFGPEICCECPDGTMNMSGASADCIGAEISLYINGELFEIYQTDPLGRVNGEEVRTFFWTPAEEGQYLIEARIDPDNIIDEFDETDNEASANVNVTIEEYVEDEPIVVEDEDSLINEPLVWVPLIGLSLAGIGMFIYNRIGGDGDYFDSYEDNSTSQTQVGSQQSGFRYNPETGETIDLKTGEIIGQSGKNKD